MSIVYLDIRLRGGVYEGILHEGKPAIGKNLPDLRLHPGDKLTLQGHSVTLEALADALVRYRQDELRRVFQERGQLDAGHYLYAQVFGDATPREWFGEDVSGIDLRIVSDDEHIARLPWVLLAHKNAFLAAEGWGISLARRHENPSVTLPRNPRMLVAAPVPADQPPTKAAAHLEELEHRLSNFNPHLSWDEHLKRAESWEEFCRELKTFQPHIVYYYGHGKGDRRQSRLLFCDTPGGRTLEVPLVDLRDLLAAQEARKRPLAVYLNCCQGDSGGLLGAGWQLGDIVPAVITNRTIAHIDPARAQGLAIWRSILLGGHPPHQAMAEIRSQLGALNLDFNDARWMTPVLHCHYHKWEAQRRKPVDPLKHDPHWHLKLDRVTQFGTVAFQTREMLRNEKPRSLAFVWYGEPEQGVEIFHKRLNVELQNDLELGSDYMEVRPDWPMELSDPDHAFADMLCAAFEVEKPDQIPRKIREHSHGASRRKTLVNVRHVPLYQQHRINPKTLKQYLHWWDRQFAPLLPRHAYALLTVSFVVPNPAKFCQEMTQAFNLFNLDLQHTSYKLLDELERLNIEHLSEFLKTHNIKLPRNRRENILKEILASTGGNYELSLGELKQLVRYAWDEGEGG